MYTEEDIERAIDYLTNSASKYARAKGRARSLLFRLKAVEADEFLKVETGSQDYKKSVARASEAYKKMIDEYEEAEIECLTIEAYREAATAKITWAQSAMKAKAQGLYL